MKRNRQGNIIRNKRLNLLAVVGFIMMSFWLSACGVVVSKEEIVTKHAALTGFHGLELSSGFDLKVTFGQKFKVQLVGDRTILAEHTVLENNNGILKIGLTPYQMYTGIKTLKAIIEMPNLRSLRLSGASKAHISAWNCNEHISLRLSGASEADVELSSESISVKLSGASVLKGRVSVKKEASWDLSGASHVRVNGNSETLKIEASGASVIKAAEFIADAADIRLSGASEGMLRTRHHLDARLSGASEVDANVGGKLDARLSGASELRVSGSPIMGNIKTSGASHITKIVK